MIQTKNENMQKHLPFLIKKEKNTHHLTQRASRTKKPNNSLNNFNIIKINSCINLDSNRKYENTQLTSEKETNSSSSMESGIKFNVGRWTKEEHKNFCKGMKEYGNDWKMVQKIIKTRSSAQARSHAQKYFIKLKKIVKSQYSKFNAKNLINHIINAIKNWNGGQKITVNEKKRILNVIISNFKDFGKDEIQSCKMLVNDIKIISSQKDGDKSIFYENECNKNIISEKNKIIIEINNSKNNDNIEDKNNVQENKMEFCNKKRKNSSPNNKIFRINKVIKYKYINNFNKINENSKKNKFNNNIICPIINERYNKDTNNFDNLICNLNINNDL